MSKDTITPLTPRDVLAVLPPFPIALVTTRSNIITLGQIHYFTFVPLRIGIAVAHTRHTYSLLKTEREFAINVPDTTLIKAVKVCGSVSGRQQDKFMAAGLHQEPSSEVRAVSIHECHAQIECRVEREIEFEKRTWFVGDVLAARNALISLEPMRYYVEEHIMPFREILSHHVETGFLRSHTFLLGDISGFRTK